ncbi:MAG TPA: hypothetical protein VIO14_13420 [Dehalococcoidia bacterium]
MALPFLERELRLALRRAGRADLAEHAVGRIAFTDDGSEVFLHLFHNPAYTGKLAGTVFVLAHLDHEEIRSLQDYRWMVQEARHTFRDNLDEVIRFLQPRRR